MAEDEPDQILQPKARTFLHRLGQQNASRTAATEFLIYIDTNLCCSIVSRASVERLEAEPGGDLAPCLSTHSGR